MITRLKLKPGQKGTKALVEKYGDSLVCVRYRYDEKSRTRLKTVELIVEKKELPATLQQKATDDELVPVRISYRKLPQTIDISKVEFSGKIQPGGSDEKDPIYRNADRSNSQRG
jgi:hypothetical protein